MGEHVNLEVAPVLEKLLTPWTTHHRRVPTVHLLGVALEGSARSQQLRAEFALKVSENVGHVGWKGQ